MKLVVIGIDAATFRLINPWLKSGKLPTLNSLIRTGTHGILNSITIPNSIPAWGCMVTGKSQERMGSFSLLERDRETYSPKIIFQNYDELNPIWRVLNKGNETTTVINVPAINIGKISGVFIRGPFSNSKFSAIPEEIEKKLTLEGYFDEDVPSNTIGEKRFLEIINRVIDKKIKKAKTIAKEYTSDFFMFTIIATDALQHLFWKHTVKTHPLYSENKYEEEILKIYQKIDLFIGELFEMFKKSVFLIVSDHGHDTLIKDIDLNRFLQKIGMQLGKRNRKNDRSKVVYFLIKMKIYFNFYNFLKKIYPFSKFIKKIKKKIPERDINDLIDWDSSKAYSIDVRGIRINLKGREPIGLVTRKEYHKVKKEIIRELKLLEFNGNRIVKNAYSTEESKYTRQVPDILIEFHEGYNNMFTDKKIMKYVFNDPIYWSSYHSKDGIFIVNGDGIRKNAKIKGINIVDIYPTILHMFNLPIPDDIDGRVLKEIFEKKSKLARRKIRYETIDNRDVEKNKINNIIEGIDI